MELEFAKNIRSLRLGRSMTQEELADALGVSVQSVSRWESCQKASYPDVELLPLIAGFFETTVDALLGCDAAQSQKRLEQYWQELDGMEWHSDEALELLKKMHREYPRDEAVMHRLCEEAGAHREEADLIRGITEYLWKNSDNRFYRERSATNLIFVEDDDKLTDTLEKYTSESDMSRYQLLQWRYVRRGEDEKHEEIRQGNLLYVIIGLFGAKGIHRQKKDEEYNIWRSKMLLGVINSFVQVEGNNPISADGEVDLWSTQRIRCGKWLAREKCMEGDLEGAIAILSDMTDLYEKLCALPEGKELTFRTSALDRLSAKIEYVRRGDRPIYITALVKGRDQRFGIAHNTELLTKILTDENYHDNISQHIVGEKPDYFAPLRGDERFIALVERARAAQK